MAQKLNLSWGFVDRIRGELNAKSSLIVKFERNNEIKTMIVGRRGFAGAATKPEPTPPISPTDPPSSDGISDEPTEQTLGESAMPERQVRRDASGYPIPKTLAKAFGDALHHDAPAQIDRLIADFIAASRWSKWLRLRDLLHALAEARTCIIEAQPHLVHRDCRGRGCSKCRGSGFLSLWAADQEAERASSLGEGFDGQ